MLTDGVAVVNSLLRVQPTQDASRNTPEIRVGLRSRLQAGVVEWQTQQTQNLRPQACGFKSHHRHQILLCIQGRVRHHAARRVHPWPRKELHKRRLQHGEGRLKSNRGTRTENLLHVGRKMESTTYFSLLHLLVQLSWQSTRLLIWVSRVRTPPRAPLWVSRLQQPRLRGEVKWKVQIPPHPHGIRR